MENYKRLLDYLVDELKDADDDRIRQVLRYRLDGVLDDISWKLMRRVQSAANGDNLTACDDIKCIIHEITDEYRYELYLAAKYEEEYI